jgi:CRISPR-associated endoribonuclease Cas2
MSYRYMRVLVFFDLPTTTSADRRAYSRFRRFLLKSGFIMMQESVYCKLALNQTVSGAIISNIKKNKPLEGMVQILTVTEKQFSKIEMVTGEFNSQVLDNDERLIVL